jgi:hypothetical protein
MYGKDRIPMALLSGGGCEKILGAHKQVCEPDIKRHKIGL